MLSKLEKQIKLQGVPQIDFTYWNDVYCEYYNLPYDTVQHMRAKLKRAVRRVTRLSRILLEKNALFTPASICHDFVSCVL